MNARLCSWLGACIAALAFLAPIAASAGAVSVDYKLVALGTPGRFEYQYTVKNDSLATPLSWFSIDFDPYLYDESSLSISSTGTSAWSEQLLASIPVLGVPAQYDVFNTGGTPLVIGDSEAGFSVAFTWLGSGAPGSQAFTVYDASNFSVLDSGVTAAVTVTPPNGLPEPSTAGLVVLAFVGLVGGQRRVSAATRRQASR